MGLLGEGFDDPKTSAILALSGGLLRGDFGGGLLGANQAYQGAQESALKRQYMGAQMADMAQQAKLRDLQAQALARKQSFLESFLPKPGSAAPAMPGQLGSGSFGVVPPAGGAPDIPSAPAQGGFGAAGRLTPDALMALKLGAGEDLTDIYKLTQPNWQNINGNLVNTNAPGFKGGFQSGMQVTPDGKGIVTTVGPDGMPRMAPMAGSLDTYGQFQDRQNLSNARSTPEKVVGPDGAERFMPRSQVLGMDSPRPVVDLNAGNGDRMAILNQELQKAKAENRPGDVAAIEREIGRLPAGAASAASASGIAGGFQATPTAAQQTQQQVDREAALARQKDIAEQRKGIMNAGFVAPSNIARYQQIGSLLRDVDGGKLTPVGTEFASALNSMGIKVDKNLSNKEAAAAFANQAALELRNPAGGAGMPGAMSDSDRNFLASMTPNMAQSAQGRTQVINAYVALQSRNMQVADFARKYEKKYGKLDNGFFDQLQQWSNANPLFKAQ